MPTNPDQLSLFPPKRKVRDRVCVGRILHLGAGVQSSCLAEMIVEGELPPVDLVLFADTGNEPKWVYAQVRYLKNRFESVNTPFSIVRKEGLGLVEHTISGKGRWAAMPLFTLNDDGSVGRLRRQCTSEFKIEPCDDEIRGWLVELGQATEKNGRRTVKQGVYVENIYGISADEQYRAGKRGPGWQRASYPLIDMGMTRTGCEDWLKAHGLRVPHKSSCIICPYHDNSYWKWLQTEHPDEFEEACQFDDWLRSDEAKVRIPSMVQANYLHDSCTPLREIDFDNPPKRSRRKVNVDQLQIEIIFADTCSTDGGFSCFS